MKVLTIHFNDKEDFIIDDLKEIAGPETLSKFGKKIISEYVEKYNKNPILSDRNSESKKIEDIIILLNQADFWTRTIQNLDPITLRHLENTLNSIQTKVFKKMQYDTVNVR